MFVEFLGVFYSFLLFVQYSDVLVFLDTLYFVLQCPVRVSHRASLRRGRINGRRPDAQQEYNQGERRWRRVFQFRLRDRRSGD